MRTTLCPVLLRLTLVALVGGLVSCSGDGGSDDGTRRPSSDVVSDAAGARDVPLDDATRDGDRPPDASEPDAVRDADDASDAVIDAGGATDATDDGEADGSGEPGSALLPGERPCAEDVLAASFTRTPVDIVLFIDTSGSMSQETRTVEESINEFASFIAGSQLDYRVLLVAANSVCFPPPLSEANSCPDRNGPRYAHARIGVASTDGLERTLQGLELMDGFLRRDAQLHLVAVTDDESRMDASSFLDAVSAFRDDVVVHGIVATLEPDGRMCCGPRGCGARVGRVYEELATRTGGVLASICEADWQPTFETIAAAVATAATRPCAYEIPDPPEDDAVYDPERANVFYAAPDGDRELLPRVDDAAQCGGRLAWHYDDAVEPSAIELCPVACELQSASVTIELGCDTVKQ